MGAIVVWTAASEPGSTGRLQYRFRARRGENDFSIIRDFGPNPELIWTANDVEGDYEVEVTVRNLDSGQSGSAVRGFEFTAIAGGEGPVAVASWHPLVYLYGAPPCSPGSSMKVLFRMGNGPVTETPAKDCTGETSLNFLVAGLRAASAYEVWHELTGEGTTIRGPILHFETAAVGLPIAPVKVTPGKETEAGVLLQSSLGQMATAHDLAGNLVWYHASDLAYLTRPLRGGRVLGIVQEPALGKEYQAVRLINLLGLTLKETNAARVNEQLAAMGVHEITGFHHEAQEMPDGKFLVLASSERLLKNVQGSGEVDVIGDTILVLDQELKVFWAWDSFDHLDPGKLAVSGEVCTVGGGGCPPFYLADKANDWLHSNSLQLAPDGNILMSVRHMDSVVKIDYQNGVAFGEVLWRFGRDGDFTVLSDDPWPWQSHQHDANILDDGTLLLYDNGNTRRSSDSLAHSRGQRWQLDESTMTAKLLLNADVGVYAPAVGSAQRLPSGGYHFTSGMIPKGPASMEARSIETDAQGNIVWTFSTPAAQYRTFRMKDLYTP